MKRQIFWLVLAAVMVASDSSADPDGRAASKSSTAPGVIAATTERSSSSEKLDTGEGRRDPPATDGACTLSDANLDDDLNKHENSQLEQDLKVHTLQQKISIAADRSSALDQMQKEFHSEMMKQPNLDRGFSKLTERATGRTLSLKQGTRVAIHLSDPPPTRLRMSFDTLGGSHREVEWDPAVSSELVRYVDLGREKWRVSVSVDPQSFVQQSGVVLIQTRFGGLRAGVDTAFIKGDYVAVVAAGAQMTGNDPLVHWPHPRLTFSCDIPHVSMDTLEFTAPKVAASSGLRGFGVAPTFVTDTLSILTEIAMDRAKAGAMRLLKKRVVDPFCGGKRKITLAALKLGPDKDALAFPRVCALLEGLRLEDILSSGKGLLSALRDDLRNTVIPASVSKLHESRSMVEPALRGILAVLNTTIDRGGFDGLEGQLMLDMLGNIERLAPHLSSSLNKVVLRPLCQARLAVAMIKHCSAAECSIGEISDVLAAPEKIFKAEKSPEPGAACWIKEEYLLLPSETAETQQLIMEGLKLLTPSVDSQGRDRAKAAVRLSIQLIRHWQLVADSRLDAFGETVVALIDEDYGTAMSRALSLLQELNPAALPAELIAMTRFFGAVAAYTAVYRSTKDEDPKAAHEARKKALSSIIDSATDRGQREDVWITSLGSNVGFSATVSSLSSEDFSDAVAPAVRVPLGIRIERLPEIDYWSLSGHIAFQVADLGQFVHRDSNGEFGEVRWADFVSPGIELGLNLGFLGDRALNVTFHGAYAPSLEREEASSMGGSKDGVWRLGVALGSYVPFFDFN